MDKKWLENNIDHVLRETNIPFLGEKRVGKVRDVYQKDDKLILISTDRHSSFDRIIAHVPMKGQVLTGCTLFWFENTKDIIQNHILDNPDPNVIVGKKCQVLPIEVVPRAYITGVTGTSLWTHYQNGQRDFGNFTLPDGLKKNQKLEKPVLTFTTKSDVHDEYITGKKIVERKLIDQKLFNQVEDIATRLFERGQKIANERGLILVDTKYEFGLDDNGKLTLVDEIHTPDSSRYWMLGSYDERFSKGEEPEYFDKEFLRLWFNEHCDPYNDKVLPAAPTEMIAELSMRYIQIYEQITGKVFQPETSLEINQRISRNLKKYASN